MKDPTRLGLQAARELQVQSPLKDISKQDIRQLAKYLGLPNWNHAASPCLRSRLEFGVAATEKHLKRVEQAEISVRSIINLPVDVNLRVRLLANERGCIGTTQDIFWRSHHMTKSCRN